MKTGVDNEETTGVDNEETTGVDSGETMTDSSGAFFLVRFCKTLHSLSIATSE
jgi:hypothetical protein